MSLTDELTEVIRAAVRAELERLPDNAAPAIDPLEMLTSEEVGKLFKLHVDTVRAYCAAKPPKLPGIKFGHDWRLRRVDLVQWVERHGLPEGVPTTQEETARVLRTIRGGK